MTREYTEPSNEQLAHFMVTYGNTNPAFAQFNVSPDILKMIFDEHEGYRQDCLAIHRKFQDEIDKHWARIQAGEAICEYIRPNGKRCVNHNEPGNYFCGLHREGE